MGERSAGSRKVGGSNPPSSMDATPASAAHSVGCHGFRERFGYYLDRAAAGDDILVKRYGRPYVRLTAAVPRLPQMEAPDPPEARAA